MKYVFASTSLFVLIVGLSGCGTFPVSQNPGSPIPTSPELISEAKAAIVSETPSGSSPTDSPDPSTSALRTAVIWEDYEPGTKDEIDHMTDTGDCLGINSFFGMVTATEESVKARTGHGNDALTKYLNESLALAQCN